ncbi:MAG: DNA translocase FtsK 4TM domain-containing protein [Prevotella sp.]|nr:DNA translocase FtsK 4TM domain-containing protein [Prevotella sp.]
MARKQSERKAKTFSEAIGINYIINDKTGFFLGLILLFFSVFVILALISYFSTGQADQSLVESLRPGEMENSTHEFQNSCGSVGAIISYYLISRCFGIPAFFVPVFVILCGLKLMGVYKNISLWKWFFGTMLVMIWSSVFFAKFFTPIMGDQVFNPGGDHGEYVCQWLQNVIGEPGLVAILLVVALGFLTYLTSETITVIRKMLNPVGYIRNKVKFTVKDNSDEIEPNDEPIEVQPVADDEDEEVLGKPIDLGTKTDDSGSDGANKADDDMKVTDDASTPKDETDLNLKIANTKKDEEASGGVVAPTNDISTPINPRTPFENYHFPTLNLLKHYDSEKRSYVNNEELEKNKNNIIKALSEYGVEIRSIQATVGPTITLYEITPAAGIRISKIKNLENDLALRLAAIGVRIIAPIPGKGTIGIEVPNAHPNIVSMLSVLNSRAFQTTKMELPIALGKTITNEVFMVDLAKIPHLLVAGATGQGKSVGLNAIITSLLYKKHPNELKIVLVDPKKVEFSPYAPIAKHFMAATSDNMDEPIITDVQKVVRTLKGLCVLMDHRYDLLKMAGTRNIKEYNHKFLERKLNPKEGHDYMPYIVVIIDEFGDLIMTAGREIEQPITRIAQLARAVGIHMVIATQRPTTTIITGNIKANFPGRIAFKVAQGIDSKIILDRPGAERLVGRGDLLYLNGNMPTRVQCAFVDTPEIENITEYISKQMGPVEPLELPDPPVEGDGIGNGENNDIHSVDPLFVDVAHALVLSQSGSTSMIQRKFQIGYNRAGRIMDQMENFGIVGAAQGAKPREVLIGDVESLENYLKSLK